MNKSTLFTVASLLAAAVTGMSNAAAQEKEMPKSDVVDIPAIGKGLCVSNLFQTNMVLQREMGAGHTVRNPSGP